MLRTARSSSCAPCLAWGSRLRSAKKRRADRHGASPPEAFSGGLNISIARAFFGGVPDFYDF